MERVDFEKIVAELPFLSQDELNELAFQIWVQLTEKAAGQYAQEQIDSANTLDEPGIKNYADIRGD